MSDIEKFWIYLCVFFVVIDTHCSADVQQVGPITWSAASDKCDNHGLEFRESILKELNILRGKIFWLGKAIYSSTSGWMEILGCYASSGMKPLKGISSIAECQIQCSIISNLFFGYKKITNMCICSEVVPLVKADNEACENMKNPKAFFFYKAYQGSDQLKGEGDCTSLHCSGGQNNLKAVNCSYSTSLLAGICGNKGVKQEVSWGATYLTSLQFCMSKHLLLVSPVNYCTNDRTNQGITSWTNVFREVFERQLTKVEGGNDTPLQCLAGHLVQHEGQWKLFQRKRNCTEHLTWFVCRNYVTQSAIASSTLNNHTKSMLTPTKSSVTTSSLVFTSRTTVIKSKTARVTQIKPTDMNTLPSILHGTNKDIIRSTTPSSGVTKNSEKPNHQIDQSKQGNNSKTIGAVIGGLLGLCSIIVVLAALIVCKIRTIGVFKKSTKHHKQHSSQMEFSKATYQDSNNTKDKRSTTTTTSNETYGLGGNSTAVYAVVNKIKTPGNINDTYTDAGYGEYDHLHDIQNRRTSPQENLYHSHGAPRNEEDQTYDSSDFGKEQSYDGNGVYDQSFSVVEGEYSYSTNKNHDNTNNKSIYDKAS